MKKMKSMNLSVLDLRLAINEELQSLSVTALHKTTTVLPATTAIKKMALMYRCQYDHQTNTKV